MTFQILKNTSNVISFESILIHTTCISHPFITKNNTRDRGMNLLSRRVRSYYRRETDGRVESFIFSEGWGSQVILVKTLKEWLASGRRRCGDKFGMYHRWRALTFQYPTKRTLPIIIVVSVTNLPYVSPRLRRDPSRSRRFLADCGIQ